MIEAGKVGKQNFVRCQKIAAFFSVVPAMTCIFMQLMCGTVFMFDAFDCCCFAESIMSEKWIRLGLVSSRRFFPCHRPDSGIR